MAKYDWTALRRKYVTSGNKSLKVFALEEKIPYGLVRKKAAEWNRKKRNISEQAEDKVLEKVTEKKVYDTLKINEQHLDLSDKIVKLVEKEIGEGRARPKDVAQALEILQRVQRIALGIDKPKPDETGGKERLNKFVEAMNKIADKPKGDGGKENV